MQVASAYGHEPVATTSLLAYVLCHDMHPSLEDKVAWLGVLGTFGDLGSSVKWQDPFPDMTPAIKQHGGKTKFSQAVSLINARELHILALCTVYVYLSVTLSSWKSIGAQLLYTCFVKVQSDIACFNPPLPPCLSSYSSQAWLTDQMMRVLFIRGGYITDLPSTTMFHEVCLAPHPRLRTIG